MGRESIAGKTGYDVSDPMKPSALWGRNEAEAARQPGGALVGRVLDPIVDGHLLEIKGADALETGNVDAVLVGIGAPPMMRVYSACRAEIMDRAHRAEPVASQGVFARVDDKAIEVGGNRDRAAHSAI